MKKGFRMANEDDKIAEEGKLLGSSPASAPSIEGEADRFPCGCSADTWVDDAAVMPDEELLYDLADLFKVFADTTRIKILYALMRKEQSVGAIADEVAASQSAVSHQLRILKQARLVRFRRDGKQVVYCLSDDHVYTMLAQGMVHICE